MLRRSLCVLIPLCICTALSLGAESLPEFVVTASRDRQETMNEPAKVTVITAADIEKSGKTSLVQVLQDLADVRFTSYSGEAQAQVSMRGFGENSYGRVKVLVDGRELNNPDMSGINWFSIPVSSIERVEIVDGPSGVLYGSGAVGGVINVITKEPSKGLTADANLSYGSFDTMRALLNAGYGFDTAGFSIATDLYKTDGFRKRTGSRDTNVTLNGFWDATDLVTFKPSFGYADIYYQMPGSLTKDQFLADRTAAANLNDYGTERDITASLLSSWKASDRLNVELPLDYAKKDAYSHSPSYYTGYQYCGVDQHRFGAKPKATWTKDVSFAALTLNGGFDFNGALYEITRWLDSDRASTLSKYAMNQYSYAPYVSGTIDFANGLRGETGVRYDVNVLDASDRLASSGWNKTSQAVVYDAAINWRPVEGFSVYAKHNSLFRYPFVDEVLSYGVFNKNLSPETGYNFEIGSSWNPVKAVVAKFNAYCLLMNGEISYNSITYANENLDATRRLGGSLDVTVTPIDIVSLNANAGYVNAVFANGSNAGKIVPLVPALKAGGNVRFALPFGLSASSDVTWTGDCYQGGDFTNTSEKIASYALVGAELELVPPSLGGKLAIRGRADNLLDASYSPFVYYGGYYPAAGRSFTVSAAVKY